MQRTAQAVSVTVTVTVTVGNLLRDWRSARGKSQLALALDAGLSQRHLSFIESGRSAPGRGKLMDLAEALDIPLRDRNALLLSAGYAPLFAEEGWDAPQMRSIGAAVERMLRQQEPFPAVLMDRHWNVLATNDAAPRFFGRFVDLAARTGARNILHLLFDPAGLRPFLRCWDRVAPALLARVRREAVGGVLDADGRALLEALSGYAGVPASHGWAGDGENLPMIPLSFEKNGLVLNYFSMVSTVGTPTSVAAQELRVECLFPADEATERAHARFMAAERAA